MKKVIVGILTVGLLAFGGFVLLGGEKDNQQVHAGKNISEVDVKTKEKIVKIFKEEGLEIDNNINATVGFSDDAEHKGLNNVVTVTVKVTTTGEVTTEKAKELFTNVKPLFPNADAYKFKVLFRVHEKDASNFIVWLSEIDGVLKVKNFYTHEGLNN